MMLACTNRKIANAISPRIAVARMISSSVKPAARLRLSTAVNIKLDLARLRDAAAFPFRAQRHQIDAGDLGIVVTLQHRRHGTLHQDDVAITDRKSVV